MTDRLTLTRALEGSGMQSQAAERIATEIYDAIHDNVATNAELQRVETALKAELTRIETSLKADLQRVEAALKADLTILRADTEKHIAGLRTDMLRLVIAAAAAVMAVLTAIHYFVPVTLAH